MFIIATGIISIILLSMNKLLLVIAPTPLAVALIALNSFAALYDINNKKAFRKYSWQLFMGYSIRLFLLFWDLFARSVYQLPNSGADSEFFYNAAIYYSNGGSDYPGSGEFGKTMGWIFSIIGPNRLYGQYIIMMFSIIGLLFFALILNQLNVDIIVKKRAMGIVCILPNFAILSSIFLRESIVMMFITISVYFFVRWMKTGRELWYIIAFAVVFLASIYHSGSIGMAIGYIIVRIIYNSKQNKIILGAKNIIVAVLVLLLSSYLYLNYGDVFFGKMLGVESITDIGNTSTSGGSSYNQYVGDSSSIINIIIYTIPRMVYFLMSPFPWQWRGIADIIAFFFSALYYMIVIIDVVKILREKGGNNRIQIILLSIVAISVVFVFGWGVSNTGTAARHREKLVLLFGTLYALSHKKNKGLSITLGEKRII